MSLKNYTYEDYCCLDDEQRYEIINGIIHLMAGSNRQHQTILREVFAQLVGYFRDKPCELYVAPFDVQLPLKGENPEKPRNVVQPDLLVVCDQSKLDEAGCVGAPDLIIEILSPSTASMDMLLKRKLYEQAGVPEYWIVDPVKQQVIILRLINDRYDEIQIVTKDELLLTPLFSDLAINLLEIFRE